MKKIALLLALFYWEGVYAKNLLLIEFNTDSYDSTVAWLTEVESKGATVRHLFPPNVAIMEAYGLPKTCLETPDAKWTVFDTTDLSGNSRLLEGLPVRAAYLHITGERPLEPPPEGAHFNCPPPPDSAGREIETWMGDRLTGQYMIGYIAVGIYLMESNGSQENWYPAAEQQTFNEIVQGLDWLAEQGFQRGAKVVWVYAPVRKIGTAKKPFDIPANSNVYYCNENLMK
jgi:hypothetical protein